MLPTSTSFWKALVSWKRAAPGDKRHSGSFHTWSILICTAKDDLFPMNVQISLGVALCSHYASHCEAGQSHTPWALFSRLCRCMLVTIATWESVMATTTATECWCSEEEKCVIDILPGDDISKMLDTTRRNTKVYKTMSEQIKERGWTLSWTVPHKDSNICIYPTIFSILTSDLFVPAVRQNTSRLYVLLVGWILTAIETLKGFKWNWAETTTSSRARLFCSASELCSHVSERTEPKGKRPLVLGNNISNWCRCDSALKRFLISLWYSLQSESKRPRPFNLHWALLQHRQWLVVEAGRLWWLSGRERRWCCTSPPVLKVIHHLLRMRRVRRQHACALGSVSAL